MKDSISPGLYIHVPFCRTKCPYCGFFSVPSTSLIPRWLEGLKKEIKAHKGRFKPFDTLYFGGGTPSLLDLNQLEQIVDHLFTDLEFTDDREFTIEVNPLDIDKKMLLGWKCIGFNRINLGVQSFNENELRFLGRRHNGREAEQALNLIRSSGFENIGLDLIYGLEGQSLEGWRSNMEKALQFSPEHISCYQLTYEEKTIFWRMKEKGTIIPLDEKKARDFFLSTSGFMEENGYLHYEISNFAAAEKYFSRHNSKYWFHAPYLGLGPSSHSFMDSRRWWNISSVRSYCNSLEKGALPIGGEEWLDEEQLRLERISLGLRTYIGFHFDVIKDIPDIQTRIAELEEKGLIRLIDKRIIPTKQGFLLADSLPLYFFN